MPSYPKFIADAMLGHVVRWLRILGYDIVYHRVVDDWKLIVKAKEEGRILLTRDRGLANRAKKQGIRAVFIEEPDIVRVLVTLSLRYGIRLEFDKNDTRCPQCNTPLKYTTSVIEVSHKVDKNILLKYREFWLCPSCGKVYWQGNHWRTIKDILERAKMERLKALSRIKPIEKNVEWLKNVDNRQG